MRLATISTLALLAALSGCAGTGAAPDSASATGGGATATLADVSGAPHGIARFEPAGGGLKLTYTATGLPPGEHGIHVHTVGRCDAPDFQTAGAHWNPTTMQHGTQNPQGPHRGDIPNIVVAADGTARYEAVLTGAMLTGDGALLDADGASLLVHATADDYRTDPSGNSGARIACGVIQAN